MTITQDTRHFGPAERSTGSAMTIGELSRRTGVPVKQGAGMLLGLNDVVRA